ncbi:hypothetical protein N7454_009758 [Penicillium verhagenii]|nr:hypothetical protein N7454_009758 [Penicillium verhagenii]
MSPKEPPYYFPEMMPDQDEIADRLNALHEAGFASKHISKNEGETSMHQDQAHDLPQQSIATPDATTIDTSRARMLILPDSESSAGLAESLERSYSDRTRLDRTRQGIQNGPFVGQTLRIDWVITEAPIIITTPPIIPSMVFLFFIAAVLCIATVVRGVRRRH